MNMFEYGVGDVVECVYDSNPHFRRVLTKGKFYTILEIHGDMVDVIGDTNRITTDWKSSFVRVNWYRLKKMKDS